MQLTEAILQALQTAWSHKLRSFFTLLGIIVSVAFLVAVVAVIPGMNPYVRERIGGAVRGVYTLPRGGPPHPVGRVAAQEWRPLHRPPIPPPRGVPSLPRAGSPRRPER